MEDDEPSAKKLFFKTRLCKFHQKGRCKLGSRCSFAHGTEDVTPKPDFYRTLICPSLVDTGSCPDIDRCGYAHSEQELRTVVAKALFPTLQQMLAIYGVPAAPGKFTKSQLPPDQPPICDEQESALVSISPQSACMRVEAALQQDLHVNTFLAPNCGDANSREQPMNSRVATSARFTHGNSVHQPACDILAIQRNVLSYFRENGHYLQRCPTQFTDIQQLHRMHGKRETGLGKAWNFLHEDRAISDSTVGADSFDSSSSTWFCNKP